MSELIALGTSHKTASLSLRERIALTDAGAERLLGELREQPDVHEAVVLSTCNRTELYLVVGDPVEAETAVVGMLARRAELRPTELLEGVYSLRNCDAARHLYRVVSGLDSMVVGEAEVQGQVKRAYELALQARTTGPLTNKLFRAALETGKRVRTETGISEGRNSVASVAVELAQRTLGDLASRLVLVVGAGETAELTARALAARGVEPAFIANRRYDRAIGLAQRFGGRAIRFEELPEQMVKADIVVSSTSSPHHVIEREALAEVMAARDGRPLLLIDLAVPRDVHPDCRDLDGVGLFDMDDLQSQVERNASSRQAEARRAESILKEELARFQRWLGSQDVVPTIAALRARADEIVDRVLAENDQRWESLNDADRERLQVMARAIASRLLHEPTLRLKRSSGEDDAYVFINALRELFGLDAGSAPPLDADAEVRPLRGSRRRKRSAS